MEVLDGKPLTEAQRATLAREVLPLGLLQDVLRWGFGSRPPCEVIEVIVQDEYSHDVVLSWPLESLYLAFDST